MHGTVSPLRNLFLSVIVSRMLGFRRRQNGRLFLDIAGFLVSVFARLTGSLPVFSIANYSSYHIMLTAA